MDISFFRDDIEIYGSHNCHINALNLIMKYYKLDSKPFYKYNYNVNIGKNDHHFGGNVSYMIMIDFLRKVYKLQIDELNFQQIPLNEMVVLPIDSYDLPYIENRNEIKIGMQIHYVLAVVKPDGKLHIYDPYYKKYHEFEMSLMMNSWNVFSQPIVHISKPNLNSLELLKNKNVEPYLLNVNYEEKYENFAIKLKNMLNSLGEEGAVNSELFKRYFSCFKSILIIRKKHFEVCDNHGNIFKEITSGWGNILKEMCKMSLRPEAGMNCLFGTLDQTIELEIDYLKMYHY